MTELTCTFSIRLITSSTEVTLEFVEPLLSRFGFTRQEVLIAGECNVVWPGAVSRADVVAQKVRDSGRMILAQQFTAGNRGPMSLMSPGNGRLSLYS